MALRSLKYVLISILCFVLSAAYGQSEHVSLDSMFLKFYNSQAEQTAYKNIASYGKPVILISTSHCSACVKYFAKSQKNYQFIFVINNKSLLEIERLLSFYKLNPKHVYFIVPDDIVQKKKVILSGPTPLAFVRSKGEFYFVDYPVLNTITQEFTAPPKKVRQSFKACDAAHTIQ